MAYYDDYDRGRSGVRYVERTEMLSPGPPGLHRTRSVGAAPVPQVQIINRVDDHGRSPSPYDRGRSPSAHHHHRASYGEELVADEIAGLRADLRRGRSRDPYRDPSPAAWAGGGQDRYRDWQVERYAQERIDYEREANRRRMDIARLEERIAREDEEARFKSAAQQIEWRAERQRLRADAKAKADAAEEEDRVRRALRDKEETDRKAKDEQARAVRDWQRKKDEEEKERKDEAKRAVEEYERKKREEKENREKLKLQFKLEEEEEKKKEKERLEELELLQRKKKEKEEKDKKEKEAALEAEMHKRLGKFGFQDNQIDAMLKADDKKAQAAAVVPVGVGVNALAFRQPKYIKIHRNHLSVETLKYYRIPYDDKVSSFSLLHPHRTHPY